MIDDLTIDALADAVQRRLRPRAMPYPDTAHLQRCQVWDSRCLRRNKAYWLELSPAYRYHASRPSAPRYAR